MDRLPVQNILELMCVVNIASQKSKKDTFYQSDFLVMKAVIALFAPNFAKQIFFLIDNSNKIFIISILCTNELKIVV